MRQGGRDGGQVVAPKSIPSQFMSREMNELGKLLKEVHCDRVSQCSLPQDIMAKHAKGGNAYKFLKILSEDTPSIGSFYMKYTKAFSVLRRSCKD